MNEIEVEESMRGGRTCVEREHEMRENMSGERT
jgi:hypothetical protein